MLLNVKPILHTPGKRLDFQFELDLSDMEFSGRYPISRPVAVSGEVRNTAGILELTLNAQTTLDAVCDRCDCIAFPKNNSGRDVMIDAPAKLDPSQLDELNLIVEVKNEEGE